MVTENSLADITEFMLHSEQLIADLCKPAFSIEQYN